MNPLDASAPFLALWGLIATLAMTSILEASRGTGFSRLSLPFLLGTFFTSHRRRAMILGRGLHHWRLVVCIRLFRAVCERSHLHMVVWGARWPGPWNFSAHLRIAAVAFCASPNGFGISFGNVYPATRAAWIPGDELRLSHTVEYADRSDRVRRNAWWIRAAWARRRPVSPGS